MKKTITGLVEIFCINLKQGSGDTFHRLYIEKSIPLQKKFNVDLIAFGPSLHDKDSWFVVRSYKDLADRRKSQDLFYGSDEWKQGPREEILAAIENYTTVVVPANAALLEGLRMIHLL